MSRSALVFLESLGNLDESIRYRQMLRWQGEGILRANLYRAYGVIVPLVISDNNSDKERGDKG